MVFKCQDDFLVQILVEPFASIHNGKELFLDLCVVLLGFTERFRCEAYYPADCDVGSMPCLDASVFSSISLASGS